MNQNPRRPRVGTVFIFTEADGLTRYSSGGGRVAARGGQKLGLLRKRVRSNRLRCLK